MARETITIIANIYKTVKVTAEIKTVETTEAKIKKSLVIEVEL